MSNIVSYRNRLLLWIMPTLIVGLLSLSTGAYWFMNNVIEKEVTSSVLAMTAKMAEGINTWCKTLIFEPETIAATPAAKAINTNFSAIDRQNISRNKSLHKKYPEIFLDIYAANREGVYHTVTHKGDEYSLYEGNISSREYFKSVMATGKAQITPPLVSRTTGVPTMFVVAPILDEADQPQGLIGTGISLEYVQKIAEGLKIGTTGYGIVIAQDGTIIYHPQKEFVMSKKINDFHDATLLELGKRMLAGNSGIYRYEFEGIKKVAFYQPVLFTGWSVAATIPEDELLAPVRQMVKSLAIMTLVILLLVGISIWLAARRLSKPLQELAFHAQEITAGNFTIEPVAVNSRDEIGLLSEKFNIMTTTLRCVMGELAIKNKSLEVEVQERKQAEEALQQAHDGLEQKVQEKTQELLAANEELIAMNEELTAMNEEIRVMNETLEETNQNLEDEAQVRIQVEEELLIRERQYRATTNLLTRPIDEVENCLEAMLQNALQLIKAPDGYIGLFSEEGQSFLIHHAIGIHEFRRMEWIVGLDNLHGRVYETGELVCIEDYGQCFGKLYDGRLEHMSSIIMLPLKQGDQVKGILAASWVGSPHPVGPEDIEVLRQFGDLASVALERANIHAKSRYMAFHDELTGLPNRASLNLYMEEELEKSRCGKVAGVILFIDVDDLKSVNDNFGHSSGDIIIIEAGRHIQNALGEHTFIARLGGDEFIAMISGESNGEGAAALANKAIAALSKEYEIANQNLHMSASIGVVLYPNDGDIAEELLKKADTAMYAAKKAGRNCWRFYEPALLEEAYEKIMLTNGLRNALKRNELVLHYQPQFTLNGRNIVGFEALLRWKNPEYGLVSPMRFIPLAEQSGLILPIGQWVLEEACRFAQRLCSIGKGDIDVAVNISPKQLRADDFVANVCSTIEKAGIEPKQITIEVTESILIESIEESIARLLELRQFGIPLALDDFGTGYSSLTYLKSLPVNILKIDKSFIDKDSTHDVQATQLHVVGSIITLGHALGLTIVAEGVETAAQLDMLTRYGCNRIQGYIFSRPLTEDDAICLLS